MPTEKDMFAEEPEPLDEEDPEVEEDLFDFYQESGYKPEHLKDFALAERYRQYLLSNN